MIRYARNAMVAVSAMAAADNLGEAGSKEQHTNGLLHIVHERNINRPTILWFVRMPPHVCKTCVFCSCSSHHLDPSFTSLYHRALLK